MKKTMPGWVVRGLLVGAVGMTARGALGQSVEKSEPPAATNPVAFEQAEKDAAKFKLTKGLEISVFAAEPQLANPVQMCTDQKGRWWIAETFRYRLGGVVDVRNVDWWDEDLASKTVEDRIALITRKMGSRIGEMSMNTERLQLVEDTDGDGKADRFSTVDDHFNSTADGIASGVLARDGDVWFADIPNLWLIHTKDGKETSRKVLQYGYGVHYSLEGHDLHGLVFGPDGRLYFSIGDRGLSVKTDHGLVQNIESGSVLRCQPDGSGLEIYATGLRNPQDLVFDEHGDLFAGDNNCDYGDPGRWVYVVDGGDSGWRLGYQRIQGGPWMSERQWALPGETGGAAYILPPVAYISSGPSGNTFEPTGALGERYRGHFFLCDFRGGRVNSGIWSFGIKPMGASFELTDRHEFVWQMLATDVKTGNDGAIYTSDWVDGWPKPEKGRIERIYDPNHIHDASVVRSKRLIEEGMEKRPVEELAELLGYPDLRVRQLAQFEMVKRGGDATAMLYGIAQSGGTTLARLHAIWGIWQLGEKDPRAVEPLVGLLGDSDDEVRAQAAHVLGDCWCLDAHDGLVKLLGDKSPRVRFMAGTALGRVGKPADVKALMQLLAENDNHDAYVRHGAIVGLQGSGDVQSLIDAAGNPSTAVRLGALVTLRRLKRPEVELYLKDKDAEVVLEAARAINDVPINEAMPALAGIIGEKNLSEPVWKRVINANYRLGTAETARALAEFAARGDGPENMRVEALTMLQNWEKPDGKDWVMGLWRPVAERDGGMAKGAVQGVLGELLKAKEDGVRVRAIEVAHAMGLDDEQMMFAIVSDESAKSAVRAAALDALVARGGPKTAEAVNLGLSKGKGAFRETAIRLLAKLPDAVPRLNETLQTGSVADQQMVLRTLASVEGASVDQIESEWMKKLMAGEVAPALQLDLLETAQKSKAEPVKEEVKKYMETKPKGDLMAEFKETLYGGDAELGHHIFAERADVSCIRCHQAGGPGGTVGPNLAGIGTRHDRNYILESVLLPNKQIAPGYDAVTLKLKDGKSVSGVLKGETAAEYSVDVVDKGVVKVAKGNVVSRSPGQSPMPEGLWKALSKQDMRNLVEFLATVK
ncbi:MAG TPA: HEAT repeat domain-containing protein [Tepidisphaeraceae bacterium]|jgi:quinoprotein glucose dehydrogenase|nr:HEAT repeat domain-containing protein [Tepidisphaeraceae bacterium]